MRNLSRFWENIIKIEKQNNIGQIILNVGYLNTSVRKQLLIQVFIYKPVSKQNFGQKL